MAGTDEYRKMDEEWGGRMEELFGITSLGFPEGVDSSRLYMFSSNLKQFLTMMNPDVPHIMTGYENIFGKESHGYKKMKGTWEIRRIIPKYHGKQVYCMFLYNPDTDTWDVIEKQMAENLTEKFGFAYNTSIMDHLQEGDVVHDEVLYKSTSYDEHMNYRMGKNARVMYVTDNATIEDAIKLRRGWAKGVQSVEVDEVRVSINSNDILKNVYGAPGEYKCFPEVGEYVRDSTVCAVARVNLNHAIFDFQDKRLRTISDTDVEYFAPKHSMIYDIDVYYNGDDEFPNNIFYQQLKKYYDMECEYADAVSAMCEEIEESGAHYTPQVSYIHAKYQHFTDRQYKWKDKDRAFANLVVVFKTIAVVDLEEGFKLTGRYGDKGIISKITNAGMQETGKPAEAFNAIVDNIVDQLSDDNNPEVMKENAKEVQFVDDCDMPYYITEDGEKVVTDILLNSSGSIRRLNTDQLYEVEINFIAEQLQRKIKKLDTIEEKAAIIFRFLELLNLEENQFFLKMWNSWDQTFDVDGLRYEILSQEDQTVELAIKPKSISYPTYSTYSGDITIPSEVVFNGRAYKVVAIGNHAFSNCYSLGEIFIPQSVESIGFGSFSYSNISEIVLPGNLKSIGAAAFRDSDIKEIIIPESVKEIESTVFANCRNLQKVQILTNQIDGIPDNTFDSCSSLKEVNIPSSVKYLGRHASAIVFIIPD